LFAEEAKQRQRHHGGTAPGRKAATLPEKIPEDSSGEARASRPGLGHQPPLRQSSQAARERRPGDLCGGESGQEEPVPGETRAPSQSPTAESASQQQPFATWSNGTGQARNHGRRLRAFGKNDVMVPRTADRSGHKPTGGTPLGVP
jgi:hypothetical protein